MKVFINFIVPDVEPQEPKPSLAAQKWKTLQSPEYNGYFALLNPDTGKVLTARTASAASFQG